MWKSKDLYGFQRLPMGKLDDDYLLRDSNPTTADTVDDVDDYMDVNVATAVLDVNELANDGAKKRLRGKSAVNSNSAEYR